MAKRAYQTKKTLVDPLFALPPGSEDEFEFSREGTDGYTYSIDEDISEEDFDDDDNDDGDTSDTDFDLDSPEIIGIVSQSLRRAPGGQQVIDVVVEAEDVSGATNYEIQVTKL